MSASLTTQDLEKVSHQIVNLLVRIIFDKRSQLSVNHSSSNRPMPEIFLNDSDVSSVLEKMSGIRMTKRMHGSILIDAQFFKRLFKDSLNAAVGQWFS